MQEFQSLQPVEHVGTKPLHPQQCSVSVQGRSRPQDHNKSMTYRQGTPNTLRHRPDCRSLRVTWCNSSIRARSVFLKPNRMSGCMPSWLIDRKPDPWGGKTSKYVRWRLQQHDIWP
eukprot:364459-Chlamydomonas_euryale.AAC.4